MFLVWFFGVVSYAVNVIDSLGTFLAITGVLTNTWVLIILADSSAPALSPLRTCRGCWFFDPRGRSAEPHWCGLFDAPLRLATLRLDCPEFEASDAG